jgi:hypothetical protein
MSERLELTRARYCGWWHCPRIRSLNIVSMNTLPRRRIRIRAADVRKPVAYKVYERERQNRCARTRVSCSVAYLSRGEGGKSGYESNGYC